MELTVIFPIILFLLLAVIFFAIFIYHKFTLLDTAVYAARESAATWSNSSKDTETGSLNGNIGGDGLYWRIYDDYTGSPLVDKKIVKADRFASISLLQSLLGEKETGSVVTGYNRGLVKRAVSTKIERGLLSANAKAEVTEPAEFIRIYTVGKEYLVELYNYLKTFGQEAGVTGKSSVIASRKSNVFGQKLYHFLGCRHIVKIKQENLIEFGTEDEALKGGFSLCIDCAKLRLRGQGK